MLDYKRPDGLRPGPRARGRRLRDGHPDRRRAAALGPRGHDRRWRARPHAPHLPVAGHHVVARQHRPSRRALRSGRRPRARPQRALAAARRDAGPHRPRPQRAGVPRGRARGAVRGGARRHGLLLRLAAQRLHARRPQAQPPARHHRRLGGGGRARRRDGARVPSRPACRTPHGWPSTSSPTATRRWSGRQASAPTTRGSSCPCSTARARSATTAASSATRPGSTGSASTSSGAASPASSMAPSDDATDLVDHVAGYLETAATTVRRRTHRDAARR